MPELPEVETIRRDLTQKILHKKIKSVLVLDNRSLRGAVPADFVKKIIAHKFVNINRSGKLLIFEISTGNFLLIHLKMTGQLIYEEKVSSAQSKKIAVNEIVCHDKISVVGGHSDNKLNFLLPNKHTKVVFEFLDNSKLYFNDQRIFGYLKIVNEPELKVIKTKFGAEPLSAKFTFAKFLLMFGNKKNNLKSFLLQQNNIAGIGNIYADEICFGAGVLPSRRINSLTLKDKKNIFQCIKKILQQAVKHRGTTFNNYRDANGRRGNFVSFLKVYGREKQNCLKCGHKISKTKIASRGTHFCSHCQK